MPSDSPMTCTVHYSKVYSVAMLVGVLVFAAVLTLILPHTGMPTAMRWAFAFAVSAALVVLIHSLVTRKVVIRVDETGILDCRGWRALIAWADVAAVERLPKVQRIGHETQHYLREEWRPLLISVRDADDHTSRTPIQIEFMGLTPGSDVVEACIRRHLARTSHA